MALEPPDDVRPRARFEPTSSWFAALGSTALMIAGATAALLRYWPLAVPLAVVAALPQLTLSLFRWRSTRILVREVARLRASAWSVTSHHILKAVADGYVDREAISIRLGTAPDVDAVITSLVNHGLLDVEWVEHSDHPPGQRLSLTESGRSALDSQ